jgi:hypothetical protein
VLQGLRDINQPVQVHEYGGFYHTDWAGFLFGPVGDPVADLNSRWMRVPENKMSFQCAVNMNGVRVDPGETRRGQQMVVLMEKPQNALPRNRRDRSPPRPQA